MLTIYGLRSAVAENRMERSGMPRSCNSILINRAPTKPPVLGYFKLIKDPRVRYSLTKRVYSMIEPLNSLSGLPVEETQSLLVDLMPR